MSDPEFLACEACAVSSEGLNPDAVLPYGLTVSHVQQAMAEFVDFLTFVNQQLHGREIARLETLLMPANFSSMVGELMAGSIPKHCGGLSRNRYHNGHPDLVPAGLFPGDSVQYTHEGIEVKASRYPSGWQGHNAEESWLMVFVFDGNRPADEHKGVAPKPFRFLQVVGAPLTPDDWAFAGRSAESRRTITASVKPSGHAKMTANWIYHAPASGQ